MNRLQKAALWLGFKTAGLLGRTVSLTDSSLGKWFGQGTYTGRTINEESAMQISVVWSCVRILSETIGAMPWAVYERDRRGNATKVDHDLGAVMMGSPNADMTSTEYREAKVVNLCLRGNAYSLIDRNGAGNVASLYPVVSQNVQPKRTANGEIVYTVLDRGKWETFPREKVWHVKGFGSNGLEGFSPIGYVRQAMGLSLATEEFGARFFSNGAAPAIVFTLPTFLKDDQRKIARKNLEEMYSGLQNAHKPFLMEGGMKPETITMPLEDAQFLQTRKFQLQEICRIYRVPPHMVADLERATFSNIEHLSLEFVTFTLMPYLTRMEQAASKWLFKPSDRNRFFLRFNFEGLLRADTAARAEFYSKMLQNGVYSRNEVRALENMQRVDGLDEYTVQTNMTPVDLLAAIASAQAGRGAKP